MASINTRKTDAWRVPPVKAGINEALLWRYKREQQRAWLASGWNGAWFADGMARNSKTINSPY